MRKIAIFLLVIVLFISSCVENEENSKPEFLYENVVDSTFVCEVLIENEKHIFDKHKEFIGHSIIGKDSVLLYFEFHYENEQEFGQGEFIIQFCKFFAIEDLENKVEIEDEWYFFDCLEQHEFLSIFQEENLQYCDYNLDKERQISDGISIIFNGYGDAMWKTNFTALYLEDEGFYSFYENSNFNVTHLDILDENNIIIECSFNLEMFSWRSQRKNFSKGYFKGYIKNPYSSCR